VITEDKAPAAEPLSKAELAEWEAAFESSGTGAGRGMSYPVDTERFFATIRALQAEVATLERVKGMEEGVKAAQQMVDKQAEDEALWTVGGSIVEAYVQQELRKLSEVVEHITLIGEGKD